MKNLSIFVLVLILGLNVVNPCNGCPIILRGYVVHIKSDIINDNVTVRCQSKDDDLGYHVLHSPNLEYQWKFCETISGSTLFFCHFWWQNKEQIFDVFNISMAQWCFVDHLEGNTCNWEIKDDGFYFFEPHNYVWLKQYSWKQIPEGKLIF
ncbi:putative plant self-incompatibility S1 [Helianthus anomalus]